MLGSSKRDKEDPIIKKENKKREKKSKPNKNFIKERGKQKNKPKNTIFSKTHVGLKTRP
jgi:hypothetical protein